MYQTRAQCLASASGRQVTCGASGGGNTEIDSVVQVGKAAHCPSLDKPINSPMVSKLEWVRKRQRAIIGNNTRLSFVGVRRSLP
ncbi:MULTISPECIES: DUF3551 domain-containing protein [unclassified Bradyrhizobium]|nr:DUF3551 domain-containing protein [Bradyrhizobium sp. USDA 4539]